MDVTFELPDAVEALLDEERAKFLADALRARASGEHGKISKPEQIRALADTIDAHANGAATGPVRIGLGPELDPLISILNVAAMGDGLDQGWRMLHRAVRAVYEAQHKR